MKILMVQYEDGSMTMLNMKEVLYVNYSEDAVDKNCKAVVSFIDSEKALTVTGRDAITFMAQLGAWYGVPPVPPGDADNSSTAA